MKRTKWSQVVSIAMTQQGLLPMLASSVASSPSLSSGFVAMAPLPWDSTDSNQSVSDSCATSPVVSAPHTISAYESSDLGTLTPLPPVSH